MKEIIFYARGGQGAVTAAAVLVEALSKEAKYAQAFPFFGGERRGAPVRAFLRIDDKPITTRGQIYQPDCIVVLDSKLPATINVCEGLKQGGIAVLNAHSNQSNLDFGVQMLKIGTVDANRIADTIFGSMAIPFTNFAMLGAFAATTGWVSLPSIIEASYSKFTGNTAKNNEKALKAAYETTKVVSFKVAKLAEVTVPRESTARKVKLELSLGMVINKENNAKTGSWRTRKPLPVNVVAPCTDSCPAGINIRDYIELVEKGNLKEACLLLKDNNPLPAITGRVCYHPCESKCNRKNFDDPIAIHAIERFVGDHGLGLDVPNGKISQSADNIAVIGSGPAGLSAAYFLARKLYHVTIFESLPVVGGMLRVGIPEYRLPRNILDAEIDSIKSLGVEIKNNVIFGKDITADKLFQQGYKAIFIATGAHKAQDLGIPGDDSNGVVHGVAFLQNISLGIKVKVGRKTVVIGGGNVAIDAARSAVRLGSKEVVIIYRRSRQEMPASEDEILSCESEGIRIEYLAVPIKILTNKGKVVGVECVRMKLGNKDASGRKLPVTIPGSEFTIDADMIIPAIGQTPDLVFISGDQGIKITNRGTIAVDSEFLSTSRDMVYAGGDAVCGPATVVEAIAAGKKAAIAIDTKLRGQPPAEKTKAKIIEYKDLNVDYFSKEPRQVEAELPMTKRRSTFREVNVGLIKSAAMSEAKRCFHCGACDLCEICSSLCPEGILSTAIETGWKPDLDQCKGCGICANECPRGAVEMVLER